MGVSPANPGVIGRGISAHDGAKGHMAWIQWIDESDAEGDLKRLYEQCGTAGRVDHILKIHSLNPPSLEHHYHLYAHLMRGPSGLTEAEREMIAVVVSGANDCFY